MSLEMSNNSRRALSCNLPGFEFRTDNVTFQTTEIIKRVHESSPRFGHSSNITDLLFGTKEEGKDYLWGVFAGSIAIALFIVVWLIAICGCTIAGPKRVGMLSGRQAPPTPKPEKSSSLNSTDKIEANETDDDTTYNEAVEAWEENARRHERRLNCARITVLVCSAGIVVCAIIMIAMGIQNLVKASESTLDGVSNAHNLTNQAIVLIDKTIDFQNVTVRSFTEFASSLNEICPNVTEKICADLSEADDQVCDFEGIPSSEELQAILEDPLGAAVEDLLDYRNDLVEFSDILENVNYQVNRFDWAFWVAALFAGLLAVVNLLIITGVIAAWRNRQNNCARTLLRIMRHWFLVPLFGFLVLLSWIFSMVFIIGSTAAADTCVNNPDELTSKLLVEYGDFLDTVVLKFLLYYIEGCPAGEGPLGIRDEVQEIQNTSEDIIAFINELTSPSTVAEFQQTCGTDITVLNATATALVGTVCGLGELLMDLQYFFSCANWRPLYRAVVYDAVCYQGNDGLHFVSIPQFIIVVLALVMLTLRVAFSKSNVLVTDEEEKQDLAVWRRPVNQMEDGDHAPSDEDEEPPPPPPESATDMEDERPVS